MSRTLFFSLSRSKCHHEILPCSFNEFNKILSSDISFVPTPQFQQTRSKVHFPNDTAEARAARHLQFKEFNRATAKWRRETESLCKEWRRSFALKEIEQIRADEAAAEESRVVLAEQKAAAEHRRRQAAIEVLLRKTEVQCQLAMVSLERSKSAEEKRRIMKKAENLRYALLLEESKNWIDTEEELNSRIMETLENPEPFGFIVDLPVSKGL
uniref:Uncharacterized protein n=1 Tax=Polytomella parva TaxID=51329 RepID=A0A7S0YEV9_9CHLO|mmetsp:Transcript_22762/g.40278  ORF Transcript_22762/g.40278 Transcript_22762/m.40278 type:complete len:212 (+) Transcript_22762:140-775(+)